MAFTPILPKRSPVNPGDVNRRLRLRMTTLVNDLWRTAANYEPAGVPSYTRTGTLKKSWSREVRQDGGGLLGIVQSSGNAAPYNKYIRGTKTQVKWAKARGWRTIKDILDEEWPEARRDFEKILQSPR